MQVSKRENLEMKIEGKNGEQKIDNAVDAMFCTKFKLSERQTGGVITKFQKVAKPKFRFGHLQEFCHNSTCPPTPILCFNMLYRLTGRTAL